MTPPGTLKERDPTGEGSPERERERRLLPPSYRNPCAPSYSQPASSSCAVFCSSTNGPKAMEETRRILRRSAHAFLQNYQSFTSTAALLVFPVSASILLSQALAPSSSPLLASIRSRVGALFAAAGFPASSELFSFLNLKFAQTIFSFVFTLPFTLTFLVLAKASIIQLVCGTSPRGGCPPFSSLLRLYGPLLRTHLCNAFVVLTANAAVFALLFVAFNTVDALGLTSERSVLCLSAAGAVIYSVVLANALVVCNLAVIVSGAENCGGPLPLLKACLLIRGRAATALSLALPTSLFMAAAEALFQLRTMKPYNAANSLNPSVVSEGAMITYLYSLLIVLDIIASCMFFKSCRLARPTDWELLGSKHSLDTVGEDEDDWHATSPTKLKLQEEP